MSSSQRIVEIQQMLKPAINGLGCELWGIEYLSQGRHSILRIYIDSESGITVDQCEAVSRQVSAILDVEDPIPNEYTLEVSSPGLDRPLFNLQQFQQYEGEMVSVRLRSAVNNRRKFKAVIKEVTDEKVIFEVDGELLEVSFSQIDKANVIPQF